MRQLWRRAKKILPLAILVSSWILFPAIWLAILPILIQLGMSALFMVGQFYVMFYYLAGRTRIETILPGDLDFTWDDYRGQPELVERAQNWVRLLRGIPEFEAMGGKHVSGILLKGIPGTGKSYLGKVIASVAGVPFLNVDCASLQGTFIGIAPLKVMSLFRKAKKLARDWGACILFLDEIDSIGRSRTSSPARAGLPFGGMFGGGVLTTLLIELDGLRMAQGRIWRAKKWLYGLLGRAPVWHAPRLLVFGSSNIESVLDPALLRPGRLGKHVRVELPTPEGSLDIVGYYLDQIVHDETMTAAKLAMDAHDQPPATIREAVNDCVVLALLDERTQATYLDWRQAVAEAALGIRQSLPYHKKDLDVITYHEAGHAVAMYTLLREQTSIRLASVYRYGPALGHIMPAPVFRRYTYTAEDLTKRVMVSLAGMAAVDVCLGYGSTGGSSDLEHVWSVVERMLREGMLGGFAPPRQITVEGKLQADPRDADARRFVNQCHEKTKDLLRIHRAKVEALAAALAEERELLGEDVQRLFRAVEKWEEEENERERGQQV